jgi:hypothetical protein
MRMNEIKSLRGRLADACEITSRGVTLFVADWNGTVATGDWVRVSDLKMVVAGQDCPRMATPSVPPVLALFVGPQDIKLLKSLHGVEVNGGADALSLTPVSAYRAVATFYGQDRGGRATFPSSGYRPQIDLGWVQTSSVITAWDTTAEAFEFDRDYEVKLKPITPQLYGGNLRAGEEFNLKEGAKTAGRIKIVTRLSA